jgi:hypothetical protein
MIRPETSASTTTGLVVALGARLLWYFRNGEKKWISSPETGETLNIARFSVLTKDLEFN